jgi:hypothetical protein
MFVYSMSSDLIVTHGHHDGADSSSGGGIDTDFSVRASTADVGLAAMRRVVTDRLICY